MDAVVLLRSNNVVQRRAGVDRLLTELSESGTVSAKDVRQPDVISTLIRLFSLEPLKVFQILAHLLTQDFESLEEFEQLPVQEILEQLVMTMQVEEHFDYAVVLIHQMAENGLLENFLPEVASLLSNERIFSRLTYMFRSGPVPRLTELDWTEKARQMIYMGLLRVIAMQIFDKGAMFERFGTLDFIKRVLLAEDSDDSLFVRLTLELTSQLSMINELSTKFVVLGLVPRLIAMLDDEDLKEAHHAILVAIHNAADSPVGASVLLQYVPYLMEKLTDPTAPDTAPFLISGIFGNLVAHLPLEQVLILCHMGVVEHFQTMLATRDREQGYSAAIVSLAIIAGARCLDPNRHLTREEIFEELTLNDPVFVNEMIECFDASMNKEPFADILFEPWLPAQVMGCLVLHPKFASLICQSSAVHHTLACCISEDPRCQEKAIQSLTNMRPHLNLKAVIGAMHIIEQVKESGFTAAARRIAATLLNDLTPSAPPKQATLSVFQLTQLAHPAWSLISLALPFVASRLLE